MLCYHVHSPHGFFIEHDSDIIERQIQRHPISAQTVADLNDQVQQAVHKSALDYKSVQLQQVLI